VTVIRLQVGPLCSNAYLLRGKAEAAGVVIDPGAEGERIASRCRAEGLEPLFIINTHGHVDHAGANAVLKAAFPDAQLAVGVGDADMVTDPAASLAAAFGGPSGNCAPDLLLEDGQELRFADAVLTVLETPGHTPGSICLLARQQGPPQLFCGDLVFRGGVGRTDLPGGDRDALAASIREKVLTLPDETVLWPGHGEKTTVGRERRENPFLRCG
jgi:glyoxylase-like metal-dependent hydrolase (beta-lactamase superfamily II)